MKRTRFHLIYIFKYIKYALVLAVLPVLNVLLQWDWGRITFALLLDVAILAAVAAMAFAMWWVTRCSYGPDGLTIRRGLFFAFTQLVRPGQVCALEIYRPLYCRILGASVVTLYLKSGFPRRKLKIYLGKRQALALANQLCPKTGHADASYRVQGWGRVALVLLSANVVSTAVIGFLTWRQVADLLGERSELLQAIALNSLLTLESIFEIVLPASAAILIALLTLVALVTLLRSLFATLRFTTQRFGGVLVQSCGFIGQTERRILVKEIGLCDIRHTPFGRILGHRPVYISAGGYRGTETPLALCRNESDPLLCALVPTYIAPGEAPLSNTGCKSLLAYIWFPLAMLAFFLLLLLTASQVLPAILPALTLPCLLFAGSIIAHIDGYFKEGAAAKPGGGIWVSYTKYFTRHSVALLGQRITLTVRENPVGMLYGRAKLKIYTPARITLRVRGIGRTTAAGMRFTR